jgi:hypothetical protein
VSVRQFWLLFAVLCDGAVLLSDYRGTRWQVGASFVGGLITFGDSPLRGWGGGSPALFPPAILSSDIQARELRMQWAWSVCE